MWHVLLGTLEIFLSRIVSAASGRSPSIVLVSTLYQHFVARSQLLVAIAIGGSFLVGFQCSPTTLLFPRSCLRNRYSRTLWFSSRSDLLLRPSSRCSRGLSHLAKLRGLPVFMIASPVTFSVVFVHQSCKRTGRSIL